MVFSLTRQEGSPALLAARLTSAASSRRLRLRRSRSSLLGVEEVPRDQTQSYGIVTIERMQGDWARIHSIVEKPRPAEAPSNLAVMGRYVFTPEIFDALARVNGEPGEDPVPGRLPEATERRPSRPLRVQRVSLAGHVPAHQHEPKRLRRPASRCHRFSPR